MLMPRGGTIKCSFDSVRFKIIRFGFIFRFNSIKQRSVLINTPLLEDTKQKFIKICLNCDVNKVQVLDLSSFPLTDMNSICSHTYERLLGGHFAYTYWVYFKPKSGSVHRNDRNESRSTEFFSIPHSANTEDTLEILLVKCVFR